MIRCRRVVSAGRARLRHNPMIRRRAQRRLLGLGLLLVRFRLTGSHFGLILAHMVLASPCVVRIVFAGLETVPADRPGGAGVVAE
jgi:hypothetical protein